MGSTRSSPSTVPPIDPSLPEAGEPAWFTDILSCAHCGHGGLVADRGGRVCPRCGTWLSARDGIDYLIHPDWYDLFADLPSAWQRLEEARGNYHLSLEQLLELPTDPVARRLIAWLRAVLGQRGPCRVLELGAGNGWASRLLTEDGHQVVASDVLDDRRIGLGGAVHQRRHTARWFGCVFTCAETLPFRAETFDCVFCHRVLGQVVDLERAFREIARVLRPGGWFVALHEVFRGLFTTQAQRVQGHPGTYFNLPENSRRVPLALAVAAEVGLSATVLPLAAAVTLPPMLTPLAGQGITDPPVWLASLAASYQLDAGSLWQSTKPKADPADRHVLPELLAHWMLIGNSEGVLLACKGAASWGHLPEPRVREPRSSRQWDSLLLACAPGGFVPIHGVYPAEETDTERYWWLQPESALLMPAAGEVELTLTCPPLEYLPIPVRVEAAWEAEETPVLVFVLRPGKTVQVKIPGPETPLAFGSLVLRLRVSAGFRPSNRQEGHRDTRLLAIKLQRLHASGVLLDLGGAVPSPLAVLPGNAVGGLA